MQARHLPAFWKEVGSRQLVLREKGLPLSKDALRRTGHMLKESIRLLDGCDTRAFGAIVAGVDKCSTKLDRKVGAATGVTGVTSVTGVTGVTALRSTSRSPRCGGRM